MDRFCSKSKKSHFLERQAGGIVLEEVRKEEKYGSLNSPYLHPPRRSKG
jgi:hypothetical protein